jgi:hypothetical protein
MSSYEDKIAEFKSRITDIGKQLADLAARRKSFALAAAEGDVKARQQIADIDFQVDAAKREEGTLSSAIESAVALDRQAEQDAEGKARHERNIAAYKLSRAIVALNEEIDLALKHLREAFERRASLLIELANTEVCDRALVMRLSHRAGPTSAAQQAGLARYLNLEMTPTAAQRPLADTNPVLLGIGEAPTDDKPATRASATSRATSRH